MAKSFFERFNPLNLISPTPPSPPPAEAEVYGPTKPAKTNESRVATKPELPPVPSPPHWSEQMLHQIPLAMFLAGLILTLLGEFLQLYAILGFLFLAAAPITFWLQRIEQRLADLVRIREKNQR